MSFSYKDDKGVSQTAATLPNPFNTNTQTVTVTVTNPLNTQCVITKKIEFVVNPLPLFERIEGGPRPPTPGPPKISRNDPKFTEKRKRS